LKEEMKSKLMNLGYDVWNLVCNGYTKTSPSGEELRKNNVALNEIFCKIPHSSLGNVMHYETAKEIWDNLQEIHEGRKKEDCSLEEPTGDLISKENNDASKDEYVM